MYETVDTYLVKGIITVIYNVLWILSMYLEQQVVSEWETMKPQTVGGERTIAKTQGQHILIEGFI